MTAPSYFDHYAGTVTRPDTDVVEWEEVLEEGVLESEGERG